MAMDFNENASLICGNANSMDDPMNGTKKAAMHKTESILFGLTVR